MAKNFAEMMKDTNLQVEAPCKLSRTKTETEQPKYFIVNLQNIKDGVLNAGGDRSSIME